MLTLYFAPGASSMAPHIALHEIGMPFKAHPISLKNKQQREPGYLAMNPEGKVPLLLIEERPLTEVAGILFFLARRFPQARLIPEDIEGQARAVSWMSYVASTLHPARRVGVDHAREVFRGADRKLGHGGWALGDYSVADIHLFRLFWRFVGYAEPDHKDYPNLFAHHDLMMVRPAVQRTLADEAAAGVE